MLSRVQNNDIFFNKLHFLPLFLSRSVKLVIQFFFSQFGHGFFKNDLIWSLPNSVKVNATCQFVGF